VQLGKNYIINYNEVYDLSKNIIEDNFLNTTLAGFSAFYFDVSPYYLEYQEDPGNKNLLCMKKKQS
jgi:hypothetical protein